MTYNGWSNYETWNVNTWLTNDQGTQRMVDAMAREHFESAADRTDEPHWSQSDSARYHLADALKELVGDQNPLGADASMFTDLLQSALDNVNWSELANNFLSETEGYENFVFKHESEVTE